MQRRHRRASILIVRLARRGMLLPLDGFYDTEYRRRVLEERENPARTERRSDGFHHDERRHRDLIVACHALACCVVERRVTWRVRDHVCPRVLGHVERVQRRGMCDDDLAVPVRFGHSGVEGGLVRPRVVGDHLDVVNALLHALLHEADGVFGALDQRSLRQRENRRVHAPGRRGWCPGRAEVAGVLLVSVRRDLRRRPCRHVQPGRHPVPRHRLQLVCRVQVDVRVDEPRD